MYDQYKPQRLFVGHTIEYQHGLDGEVPGTSTVGRGYDEQALWFVLIVHTVQTLLVIALGIYAWEALSFTKRSIPKTT